MTSLFIRKLIICVLAIFSSLAHAEHGLPDYIDSIEKKLSHLAGFFTTTKSFVGEAGAEQTLVLNVASNGQVTSVAAQEPIIDKAFAAEAKKLILLSQPFSSLPVPLSNDFPMIKLHITFVLSSQPGLYVKHIEVKGGYKYVDF